MKRKLIKIIKKIRQFYFNRKIKKRAKKYGENLKVNAKSNVNSNTILGDNVNFNGMQINGGGKL